MLRCRAAVAMVSASLRSFLFAWLLRNGLTNCTAINFATNPCDWQWRAQWCAPLHASIATTVPIGSCVNLATKAARCKSRRWRNGPPYF